MNYRWRDWRVNCRCWRNGSTSTFRIGLRWITTSRRHSANTAAQCCTGCFDKDSNVKVVRHNRNCFLFRIALCHRSKVVRVWLSMCGDVCNRVRSRLSQKVRKVHSKPVWRQPEDTGWNARRSQTLQQGCTQKARRLLLTFSPQPQIILPTHTSFLIIRPSLWTALSIAPRPSVCPSRLFSK